MSQLVDDAWAETLHQVIAACAAASRWRSSLALSNGCDVIGGTATLSALGGSEMHSIGTCFPSDLDPMVQTFESYMKCQMQLVLPSLLLMSGDQWDMALEMLSTMSKRRLRINIATVNAALNVMASSDQT